MALEAPQQQGDLFQPSDCLGHTMIVAPTEYVDHIQTINTKPGEKSPAIRVNVVDFSGADASGAPAIYRGALWFGVISNALRRQVGSFLAGRMGQGQATPGRNAPWTLEDVTGEAEWMAYMNNWLDNTQAGVDFQAEAIAETNRLAATPSGTTEPITNATVAAAPPTAPPAPRTAPPAAPPANRPPSAPPAGPPVAAAPALAAPAADPMAQLAGLPPAELAKVLALLGQQGQAAH